MNSNNLFLTKFIDRYYKKAKRKRRSSKNQAQYIAHTINLILRTQFDRKIKFTEEEIYSSFKACGFLFMESGKEEFTWERMHSAHILLLCDLFINIEPQCNHDLRLSNKRTLPSNWKEETIFRINNLKTDLELFWEEYKHLIS